MTFTLSLLLTLTTLLRYSTPSLNKNEWSDLDSKLKRKLAPLHHIISTCENPADLADLGDSFTQELRDFLDQNRELFSYQENQKSKFIGHPNKTIEELQNYKKVLRKQAFARNGTKEQKNKFHDCLRAIKHLKQKQADKEKQKTSLHQENMFNKNRWKFAKNAVNGTLDKDDKQVGFSLDEANRYYPNT